MSHQGLDRVGVAGNMATLCPLAAAPVENGACLDPQGEGVRVWAENGWKRWLGWAQLCRLEPMKSVGETIKCALWGIFHAVVLGAQTNGLARCVDFSLSDEAEVARFQAEK